MKSLPASGRTSRAFDTVSIVGREQQQDLGLERIGVLELVDEDPLELALQVPADRGVVANQIARARQQIAEIERAERRFELDVAIGGALQLLLKGGGKIGIRILLELLQVVEERVPGAEHLGAGDAGTVLVAGALPRPRQAAVAHEIDQTRFPAVQIVVAEALLQPDLLAQTPDRIEVVVEVVALVRASGGDLRELMQRRDQPFDLVRPIERSPLPRGRIVARLGQRPSGGAQSSDRTVIDTGAAGETRTSGRTTVAARVAPLQGDLERVLQPGAKRAVVDPVRLLLGQDGEQRIDRRLDRTLAQQIGAEAVDGVDVRFFERFERMLESRAFSVARRRRRARSRALRAAAASARPRPSR